MHARVAIASNALDTADLPPAAAVTLHRLLLDRLRAYGRLAFASDPDVSDLLYAIRNGPGLPPDARKLWSEVLVSFQKHKRISVQKPNTTPLANIKDIDDLRARWKSAADVAVVASASCSKLGVPADKGLLTIPGLSPDVATTYGAAFSPAIERFRNLADDGFLPHGSSRSRFQTDVLEPLAAGARTATIVDRYYFARLWRATTGRTSNATGHVAWMLRLIDEVMAPGAEVHIIADRFPQAPSVDVDHTAAALLAAWSPSRPGRVCKVSLSLTRGTSAHPFPHDRHIRFSTGAAVLLPSGFDRFEQQNVTDVNGVNWGYCWKSEKLVALQATEQRAAALPHSRAKVIERP
ncbi:hypothetical protein [Micromonospora sp. NPDC049891]|uniref:hypothetical protein n=1 Tax=Micromonospora sp. NPDC049891 TaxID=3155655 RepID=UPI0033DB65EB